MSNLLVDWQELGQQALDVAKIVGIKLLEIIGIFIGTMFVGLGVALYKLSSVGQDSLSAMVFSIMYLEIFSVGRKKYAFL